MINNLRMTLGYLRRAVRSVNFDVLHLVIHNRMQGMLVQCGPEKSKVIAFTGSQAANLVINLICPGILLLLS